MLKRLLCLVASTGFADSLPSIGLGVARTLSLVVLLFGSLQFASAQVNVLMHHNDMGRTGANTSETILKPANVNQTTFGKLFSNAVDGYVYAQPLYFANVTLGDGTAQAGTIHNVFFIATENDSVYAFDADSNGGANASPLWKASLVDAAHGAGAGETPMPNADVMTSDIVPQIGITSTPVIDPTTQTIYVVAKSSIENETFIQRLHALDVTTGQEKFGGPVVLSGQVQGTGVGSSGGVLKFDPLWENNRPALLLVNGIVYIGFAAHGDNGPWHGWLLAYNAATLKQTGIFCTSPNGQGAGIWMSGAGMAADIPDPVNHPFGRMFATTGNGTFDATTPYAAGMDFGDSILRFDLTNGVMTIQDDFTPSNQAALSGGDLDLGSGGPVLLPDQTGAHPHELVQAGKADTFYLVDRDNLSGYNTSGDNVVQEIQGQLKYGTWGEQAYWNNNVYFWSRFDNLKPYSLTAGKLSSTWTGKGPDELAFPGPTPSISSNGNTNAIVWALQTDNFAAQDPTILHAYDATNVSTEVYSSSQNATRDAGPRSVKFAVPTIANGKVFVAGAGQVSVYGLLAGVNTVATPAISPASESFTGTVTVTITDTTIGSTIYYTSDGTIPTTASTPYTVPFPVTSTETITAIATATGFLSSKPATATYTNSTQTAMPTFDPPAGSYTTPQSVAIADTSAGSKIFYTTDGTTPATTAGGSTKLYSTPVAVGFGTTTINALAVAAPLSASSVSSSTYAINAAPAINFNTGFSSSASVMMFNGSTGLDDTRLQLTSGQPNQAGSAFFNTPLNIQNFTTDFTIQLSNPAGDGMTFTIQGNGPTALGPSGGGLGYGPNLPTGAATDPNSPILKSIAIKFDLFSNNGEGANSTGLLTNGESPSTVADSIDLTPSAIDLHSGTTIAVHLAYDGTNLAMTMTSGTATFTHSWPVNIPSIVGGNTAYVGFTAATSTAVSSQKVETWIFSNPVASTFTITPDTPAVTVQAGAQATSTVKIAPPSGGSFTGTVALTCAVSGASMTNLPTCSLNPSTVTPGLQGAPSTLTINVPAGATVLSPPSEKFGYFDGWKFVGATGARIAVVSALLGMILVVLALARFQRNFRVRYAWLAAALFVALLQTACGGGGSSAPESSSTTYTVTVTGTSTGANSVKITQSTTITITVQ